MSRGCVRARTFLGFVLFVVLSLACVAAQNATPSPAGKKARGGKAPKPRWRSESQDGGSSAQRPLALPALFKAIPVVLERVRAEGSLSALSATFSYNGDSAWFVQVSGVANAAVDVPALLDSELKLEAPFLTRLGTAPPSGSVLLSGTLTVSASSPTVDVSLSTSNALYLLSDLAMQLGLGTLGITVPTVSNPSSDAPTTTVSLLMNATSGALMQLSVGLGGDWSVGRVAQRLGCSWPAGWDQALTIRNPTITITTSAGGASPAKLEISLLVSIPAIGVKNQFAALVVEGTQSVALKLQDLVSFADGLFSLSNIELKAVDGVGLVTYCDGNFLGIAMASNLNLTNLAAGVPSSGTIKDRLRSMRLSMSTVNTKLIAVTRRPKMRANTPKFLVDRLKEIVFPAFSIRSTSSYFEGMAGPMGGISMAFAMDDCGLRYVQLGVESLCLSLGDLLNQMAVGLQAPDVMTLCNLYFRYAPNCKGGGPFELEDGTVLGPSVTAAITVSIPDLNIENVRAVLAYKGVAMTGTFSMQLLNSFSILNDLATVSNMEIKDVSAGSFTASLLLTIPDLKMENAVASLTYSSDTSTYTFQVQGQASMLYDTVSMSALSLSLQRRGGIFSGSATGSLAGYSGTTAFRFTIPSSKPATPVKAPMALSVAIPQVNLGNVLRAIGPELDDLLPSFILDGSLPQFKLQTSDFPGLYGLSVGPAASGIGGSLYFDKAGVVSASLRMASSLDLGAALQQLGMTLPVDVSGVLVTVNPQVSVVSSRAASLGVSNDMAGTSIAFGLKVPPLMGENVVQIQALVLDANMKPVANFAISWEGSYSPAPYVTLNGASCVVTGGGVVVSTNGVLVSIPVSVTVALADKAAKARGAKSLTLVAKATDVSAANVLATVFPSTPDFVIALLKPASFSELTFIWDGTFNVTGSPDLSKVPGISSIMSFLGFSPQDIKLRPALGAVEIAIEKYWTLRLGLPFTGPAQLGFSLGLSMNGPVTSLVSSADFIASLRMPFLDPEFLSFEMGAILAYDSTAPPPSVSFGLKAYMTSTVQVKGFPFIKIKYIGGDIALTPMLQFPWVSLRSVSFAAGGSVLDVDVAIQMMFEQPTGEFGIAFALANVDLQRMLGQLGVNVNLGPFNLVVKNAAFSFANNDLVPEVGPPIKAGLRMAADMDFLSVLFRFDTTVSYDGVAVAARVQGVPNIVLEAFDAAQSALDSLKVDFNIRRNVKFDYVDIDLALTKTRVAFGFGASLSILGVNIKFNLDLKDVSSPKMAVIDYIKDRLLEPLTAACTKDSYGRGVGTPLDTCPSDQEKQGALCYPNCPTDWQYGSKGVLNTCYQNCPPGYRDDGVGGTGLTCSAVTCDQGQRLDGLLCYDTCRDGYSYLATRCYKNCDNGWRDDLAGMSCVTSDCNPGDDDNGAGMCYPSCRENFCSNKLTMCIQCSCPDGYNNYPLTCQRDYAAYGKGCCCTAFGCCRKKCRTGFKDDGGCMCKRDANTIWKSTYDRGAGYAKYRTRIKDSYMPGSRTAIRSFTKRTSWRDTKPLTCPPGKENDAGLCYTPCASGYVGIGPVCWQRSCPSGTIDCGTYCAPAAAGSCANFIGATWQNCRAKSGHRRAVQELPYALPYLHNGTEARPELDCEAKPLDCFCLDREAGAYANPHGPATSYVVCALQEAHVQHCTDGLVFSEAHRACDLAAKPVADPQQQQPDCAGREEGVVYFMDSRHPSTAFRCKDGQVVRRLCISDAMVWDEETGECVVPMGKPQAVQEARVCTTAACFCKGKADGKYADVVGMDALSYIDCKAGSGRTRRCPLLHMWDEQARTCSHAPRNGTALVAGCKEVDCFCVGRPDGVYDSPWCGSKGIRCVQQYPYVIDCPEGYSFGASREPFCQAPEGQGSEAGEEVPKEGYAGCNEDAAGDQPDGEQALD